MSEKKTPADIIIERFLKDVEATGTLPWQNPDKMFQAFNYFTLRPYSGFNKIILPSGEYMTKKQIDEYNKKNETHYLFQKGIKWYTISYKSEKKYKISLSDVQKLFPNVSQTTSAGRIGYEYPYSYHKLLDGTFEKRRSILLYSQVAERQHFKNEHGEMLPSRYDTGDIRFITSDANTFIKDYTTREKIKVKKSEDGIYEYDVTMDKIETATLNPKNIDEFCNIFRELSRSTGHSKRLDREGVTNLNLGFGSDEYAIEECIEEIATSLMCNECGLTSFSERYTEQYKNSVEYIRIWKSRMQNWGSSFIYIASKADESFNRVLSGGSDE
jgi:hypothetical protein